MEKIIAALEQVEKQIVDLKPTGHLVDALTKVRLAKTRVSLHLDQLAAAKAAAAQPEAAKAKS